MQPFLGEIRMFAGNFAPRGWAICAGQLIPISQNSALFSLLGTMYGGDGRTTFKLPDLRSRVPIGVGQGPGLSNYQQGAIGGAEYITLTATQIPAHNHSVSGGTVIGSGTMLAYSETGNSSDPSGRRLANSGSFDTEYIDSGTSVPMAANSVEIAGSVTGITTNLTGGSQEHYNIQPFTTVQFIIAMQGLYPSRS